MINRLSLKPLLCKTHQLPQAFICLDQKCMSTALLCSRCVKFDHDHYDHVMTLEQFKAHFDGFIDQAKQKY